MEPKSNRWCPNLRHFLCLYGIRQLWMMEKRSRASVRRSMMTEIFLNSLEVAYSVFHAAVVYGWGLLLFVINSDDEGEFVSCPSIPLIPIFIHLLGGTSVCGLFLWISGHVFDCSYKMPIKAIKVDPKAKDKNEDPKPDTDVRAIGMSGTSSVVDEGIERGDSSVDITASPIPDIRVVDQDSVQDEADDASLIVIHPGKRFRFTIYHLAYFLVFLAHFALIVLGTILTGPLFFSQHLYAQGLDTKVCNETLFWYSLLMILCEYFLVVIFVAWFIIDVVIASRLDDSIQEEV